MSDWNGQHNDDGDWGESAQDWGGGEDSWGQSNWDTPAENEVLTRISSNEAVSSDNFASTLPQSLPSQHTAPAVQPSGFRLDNTLIPQINKVQTAAEESRPAFELVEKPPRSETRAPESQSAEATPEAHESSAKDVANTESSPQAEAQDHEKRPSPQQQPAVEHDREAIELPSAKVVDEPARKPQQEEEQEEEVPSEPEAQKVAPLPAQPPAQPSAEPAVQLPIEAPTSGDNYEGNFWDLPGADGADALATPVGASAHIDLDDLFGFQAAPVVPAAAAKHAATAAPVAQTVPATRTSVSSSKTQEASTAGALSRLKTADSQASLTQKSSGARVSKFEQRKAEKERKQLAESVVRGHGQPSAQVEAQARPLRAGQLAIESSTQAPVQSAVPPTPKQTIKIADLIEQLQELQRENESLKAEIGALSLDGQETLRNECVAELKERLDEFLAARDADSALRVQNRVLADRVQQLEAQQQNCSQDSLLYYQRQLMEAQKELIAREDEKMRQVEQANVQLRRKNEQITRLMEEINGLRLALAGK